MGHPSRKIGVRVIPNPEEFDTVQDAVDNAVLFVSKINSYHFRLGLQAVEILTNERGKLCIGAVPLDTRYISVRPAKRGNQLRPLSALRIRNK
jgi:hypothetical protein